MSTDSWYRDPSQVCDASSIAGAAAVLPLLLSRLDLIAFDADRSPRPFAALLASAIVLGLGLGNAAAGTRLRRVVAAAAGALALGLLDIGDPYWVGLAVLAGGIVVGAIVAVVRRGRR